VNHSFHILPVVDAGVDWLTATVKPGRKMAMLHQLAESWYLDRQEDGWQGKAWRWNGYSGSTVDGISYGKRDDGLIVRLSGQMALNHWATLVLYCDNVSRLDLQVTAQDPVSTNEWHRQAKTECRYDARISGGLTRTSLIDSTPNGGTFTVGSRSSDRYFRIYDKSAESEGEYPARSWRWEVEYKAALANSIAHTLIGKQDQTNAMIARLRADFWSYGITLPVIYVGVGWQPTLFGRVTDDQRRLEWLRRCIRPMVDRMSEAYDVETLSEALGFHWVTDDITGVGAVYLLHGGSVRDDETGSLPVASEDC
jgi:DNA relaxase NicK